MTSVPRVDRVNDRLAQEDIDGFLVGGASLKGPAFVTIANASKHHKV